MSELSEAFQRIESQIAAYSGENEILREELDSVRAMMSYDEVGWTAISGITGEGSPGLSLRTLKDSSKQIREYAVGNPLIKRGLNLRYSYVWSKGVHIPGVNEETGKRGRPSNLEKFYRHPTNQDSFFSDSAHQAMEFAAGTDGCFLLLGEEASKVVRPIPVSEIAGVYVNPEFSGEIWAILREWNPNPNNADTRRRWYYSDQFTGTKQKSIKDEIGNSVPVDNKHTLLDFWANRQVGWAYGVPDALAAMGYVRQYTELMMNGKTMTDALARFASKVKVGSKAGANNVGVKLGNGGAGQAAVIGEGNEMDIFSAAGKTYDFNGIRPVASLVATAMEVSIVHLLSDPGASGSSYGAASNLDLPTKRAMVARQNAWRAFIERVIKWGAGEDLNVSFPSLDDPDPYREAQVVALAWNSGTVHADEVRPRFLEVANLVSHNEESPEGVLIPNNENSLARRDIDGDGAATTTASPDQGQSGDISGTAADSTIKNDTRTDGLGEAINRLANMEALDRFEELVMRMEAATQKS